MKHIGLILAIAGLAACGAGGEPLTPRAKVGVTADKNGLSTSTEVVATNGVLTIGVGL